MKNLMLIFLLSMSLNADILKPFISIQATSNVIDIVISNDLLIVSTDRGSVESYSLRNKNLLSKIEFAKIKDFMGDTIYPKVFSVDYQKSNKKFLAVVQSTSGFRELVIIHNGVKTKLIDEKEKLFISKAKFIDENRVLIALLSNEYILYDIKNKQQLYRIHVSYSHFSDFMLNEDKTLLAAGCESGEISIINVQTGKISKILKGANVDNIYKVDFKKESVLGAGQDRRGSVYDMQTGEFKRFDADFLIYAGALSGSAKKAAFAFTEDNDIVVFDLVLNKKVHTLRGQKSTLNSIVFIDENTLVSGSDDKYIMIWKLK